MDAVLLARIQFAFTIAYHFIFVPMSIGLSIMMVAAER
ncbi:MAG TPA: cytochrome ubiquinol oxidase subunit I, partial [Thermoleophilia bacterium]|nr:cytochrome ubiquinol oxidase subunit I [Thermoleophilia bacterium]